MASKVLIVGGGIAGLATAYELYRRGMPFTLLDERPRPGGVILSEVVEGFVLDAGPDSLLVQKPEGIQLCQDLGLADRLVPTKPPRLAFVQRAGALHPLPAASVLGIPTRWGPFARTRLFSWPGKVRMAAELFVPRRDAEDDESIGAFMRRRFGDEATEFLAEPLLAGIHAGDVDRLSVRALFPRFVEAERQHGSVLRAFRRSALAAQSGSRRPGESASPATGGGGSASEGAFRSLPGGLSDMIRALMAVLPPDSIRLGIRVVSLEASSTGYRVRTNGGESLDAPCVVLATPAFSTASIVRALDSALAALCDAVPYASAATVALAFARSSVRHPLNGSGFVVPRAERTGILAGSWLSSKWPHRAPADRVLMRTFLGGARDPRALDLTDAEMVDRSLRALTPLLGVTGPPLFTKVYRWERANAQHEVGHLARVAAIENALAKHPGLFLTGSGYRGVGIPDCVADGRATARRITAALGDVSVPSTPTSASR